LDDYILSHLPVSLKNMNRFLKLLEEAKQNDEPIMVDGAMGTQLFDRGLLFGDPPEQWNAQDETRPKVRDVYKNYLDAGSQIILTNSFGGTPFRLKMHKLQNRTYELNYEAAALARIEAGERVVAGSIGPSGELFEPMGALTHETAAEGFRRQAEGLADGGVDVFWIETMSDLQEVRAAIDGCRQVAPNIPIAATMTFDTRGFTMMGTSPAQAITELAEYDLAAIGGNCGNGPDELEAVIYSMSQVRCDIPLIAKSNAGMPVYSNGRTSYNATPDVMAECARRFRAFGATIIGGCCGNTPAHIRAMKRALYELPPLDPMTLELAVAVAERKAQSDDRRERRARRG
jgi:5-methyltetrahydrofolate--homocysteine methyltransferase